MKKLFYLFTLSFLGTSCINEQEEKTETQQDQEETYSNTEYEGENNPVENDLDDGMHYGAFETYEYWAGEEPDKDMEVFNGQYWASSHWSKEYELYMHIKVPLDLSSTFAEYNNLSPSIEKFHPSDDTPPWFNPPAKYENWEGDQGSRYFIDIENGIMYIYEVQL